MTPETRETLVALGTNLNPDMIQGTIRLMASMSRGMAAATRACRELGYTRMWSIHPDQIRPIVEAFSPTVAEVDHAVEILLAAQAADWAPIRHLHAGQDTLHDRASYRYFWHVLERAHRTSVAGGEQLPGEVRRAFFPE